MRVVNASTAGNAEELDFSGFLAGECLTAIIPIITPSGRWPGGGLVGTITVDSRSFRHLLLVYAEVVLRVDMLQYA